MSRAEWGALPPDGGTPWKFGMPDAFIAHWVGGGTIPADAPDSFFFSLVRALQRYAFAEGYADVEYNLGVSPTGLVFELRGWGVQSGANGTRDWNIRGFAVVYLASPGTPLTDAGRAGLRWAWAEARRRYQGITQALPHWAVRPEPTACPGEEVTAFLPLLVNPPPPPEPEDDLPYTPDQLRTFARDGALEALRTDEAGALLRAAANAVIKKHVESMNRRLGATWGMAYALYRRFILGLPVPEASKVYPPWDRDEYGDG